MEPLRVGAFALDQHRAARALGGRSVPIPERAPGWLADRTVRCVRVFAEDRVEPVYG
jgi:hypothetical protein